MNKNMADEVRSIGVGAMQTDDRTLEIGDDKLREIENLLKVLI